MPVHSRIRAFVPSGGRAALILGLTLVLTAACAHTPAPALQPTVPPPPPDRREQLFTADEMLRRGCLDCLKDALAGYEALQSDPVLGARAHDAAIRAALLLAMRENELGLVRGDAIARARRLLGPVETASPELPGLVGIAEVIASGPVGFTRQRIRFLSWPPCSPRSGARTPGRPCCGT